jgi:hypothetical protein
MYVGRLRVVESDDDDDVLLSVSKPMMMMMMHGMVRAGKTIPRRLRMMMMTSD